MFLIICVNFSLCSSDVKLSGTTKLIIDLAFCSTEGEAGILDDHQTMHMVGSQVWQSCNRLNTYVSYYDSRLLSFEPFEL